MSKREFGDSECDECGCYNCKVICEDCAKEKFQNLVGVMGLIDEEIKIQREFLKKQPENKKSIEWRIIGMKLLKRNLRSLK